MASRNNEYIEPVYVEIGRRLRWLREQKGWSIAQVSRATSLTASTIAQWEGGIMRPGVAELLRVAHALGAPLEKILAKLPIEQCATDPELIRKRKEIARKRIEVMRRKGIRMGANAHKGAK